MTLSLPPIMRVLTLVQYVQGILARVLIQIGHFLIMSQIQMDRQYCLLATFLMQIITHFMTMSGGIHGAGLLREVLHINLGYGLLEIMRLILILKL